MNMAGESETKAEGQEKKKQFRFKRCCMVILAILSVAPLATFIVLYWKLQDDFKALERRFDQTMTNSNQRRMIIKARMWTEKKINDSEHSLKRYVDLLGSSMDSKLRKLRDDMSGEQNGSVLNTTSLQRMEKKVGSLILGIQNLSENFKSLNLSVDSKIKRLQSVLKDARGDLILVQKELTHLNSSFLAKLREISDSLLSSMENLRGNLTKLTKFTTSSISRLWANANNTNDSILNISKALSHQNSTLHSKVQDTSYALSLAVKKVDEKLAILRNSTVEDLSLLRNDLNNTQDNLRLAHSDFDQWNRSLHLRMEEIINSFHSSLKNANGNIDSLRKDFESSKADFIARQKELNEELSKMKGEFQVSKKKLMNDTSGLEERMMNKQESLEQHLNSQQNETYHMRKEIRELQDSVNHLKNNTNVCLRANIPFLMTIATAASLFHSLN